MLTGSCLCGRVAYEIEGLFGGMLHCHCSMCQKAHGAAFATFVATIAAGFRWTSGEGKAERYESSPWAKRSFCPTCGSSIPNVPNSDGPMYLPAGGLSGDPKARPEMHVFAGFKARWYTIPDALPRHDKGPRGFPGLDRPPRSSSPGKIGGSCLCGGVSFELDLSPEKVIAFRNCHCSLCQRTVAAAHTSNLILVGDALRWTAGEDLLNHFKLPDARFETCFCSVCGSQQPVSFDYEGKALARVHAGALDDDPGIRPSEHIFVGSKAPWFEISDELPQFEEWPSPT